MLKKILITTILLFFASCVAKKKVIEYKDKIVRDTVKVSEIKTVTKAINDTIVIKKPCDSLGNLRDFEKEIKTEKAKVNIKSVNGDLKATINIDSIVEARYKEYKAKQQSETSVKETTIVKFKYPLWLIITSIISILLNILLIKIRL